MAEPLEPTAATDPAQDLSNPEPTNVATEPMALDFLKLSPIANDDQDAVQPTVPMDQNDADAELSSYMSADVEAFLNNTHEEQLRANAAEASVLGPNYYEATSAEPLGSTDGQVLPEPMQDVVTASDSSHANLVDGNVQVPSPDVYEPQRLSDDPPPNSPQINSVAPDVSADQQNSEALVDVLSTSDGFGALESHCEPFQEAAQASDNASTSLSESTAVRQQDQVEVEILDNTPVTNDIDSADLLRELHNVTAEPMSDAEDDPESIFVPEGSISRSRPRLSLEIAPNPYDLPSSSRHQQETYKPSDISTRPEARTKTSGSHASSHLRREQIKAARAKIISTQRNTAGSWNSGHSTRRYRSRSRSRTRDDITEANAQLDEDFEKLAIAFEQRKMKYESRQKKGHNTEVDDVKFYRATQEYATRKNQYEANKRANAPAEDSTAWANRNFRIIDSGPSSMRRGMFANAENDDTDWQEPDNLLDEDNDADAGIPFDTEHDTSAPAPARKSKKRKTADREDEDNFDAAIESLPKAKKPKRSKATSDDVPRKAKRGKQIPSKGAVSAREKAEKKKAARKTKSTPVMTNIDSLTTANLFADAQGNHDLAPAPTFTATNKSQALKQMVAGMTQEQKSSTTIDMKCLLKATKDFTGHGSCKPDGSGGWRVKGMATSLFHYQTLGCAWMRTRETAGEEPRGGICADQMGLGKTVTMLANIVNGLPPRLRNPPPDERRTTLIVAPPALLTQWAAEIEKHIAKKTNIQVIRYRSGKGLEANNTEGVLGSFDIVLTTYNEVQRSYPKSVPPKELQTAEEKLHWWRKHFHLTKGVLHRVKWLRVVLDEAQAIKNYQSRTSLSCRSLIAQHKWALSGTPICNTVQELYPYFKFLAVQYTGSFKIFKQNYYGENDPVKIRRLYAMLNRFMIRRTHADRLFGAPLLKLPEGGEKIKWVELNDLERNVYIIVRRRMSERINNIAAKGQLQRNYANILTMMLRLRQMTGHILLVENVMRDLLEREDIELLKQLTESETTDKAVAHYQGQLVALRKVLNSGAAKIAYSRTSPAPLDEDSPLSPLSGLEAENPPAGSQEDTEIVEGNAARERRQSVDTDASGSSRRAPLSDEKLSFTGGKFGLSYDFRKYLKELRDGEKWEEINERSICSSCHQKPTDPYITQCIHIYCKECLEAAQHEAAQLDKGGMACKMCNTQFSWAKPLQDGVPDPASSDNSDGQRKRKKRDGDEGEDEAIRSWIDMKGTILPSAKTVAVKAQLMNWFEEDPKVKVIIYTQFVNMIKILRKVCNGEDWGYCTYYGAMSHDLREKAIKEFKENDTCSIMLASLKCGGIGLNLTMASKVICIDPWWNNAIEQQAFGRVFRHGQTKETLFMRFVVKGTIDEDMMKMQARKDKEIDQVMKADRRNKAPSIAELLELFGKGGDGNEEDAFIVVEDKETHPMVDQDSEDEDALDEF